MRPEHLVFLFYCVSILAQVVAAIFSFRMYEKGDKNMAWRVSHVADCISFAFFAFFIFFSIASFI